MLEKGEFCSQQSIWTDAGVKAAVKELLKESNTLFDDMRKKISDDKKLKRMLYEILFLGKTYPYNPDSNTSSNLKYGEDKPIMNKASSSCWSISMRITQTKDICSASALIKTNKSVSKKPTAVER